MTMPEHTCATCYKRWPIQAAEGCQVLTERIGERGECWAWTDDPGWEAKADKAMIDVYGKYGRRLVAERRKRGGVRG